MIEQNAQREARAGDPARRYVKNVLIGVEEKRMERVQ